MSRMCIWAVVFLIVGSFGFLIQAEAEQRDWSGLPSDLKLSETHALDTSASDQNSSCKGYLGLEDAEDRTLSHFSCDGAPRGCW